MLVIEAEGKYVAQPLKGLWLIPKYPSYMEMFEEMQNKKLLSTYEWYFYIFICYWRFKYFLLLKMTFPSVP